MDERHILLFSVLIFLVRLSIQLLPLRASARALLPAFCFPRVSFLSDLLSYLNFFFLSFFGQTFFLDVSFSTGRGSTSAVSSLESSSPIFVNPSFDTPTASTV